MSCFGDEDMFDFLESTGTPHQVLPQLTAEKQPENIKAAEELRKLVKKRTSTDAKIKEPEAKKKSRRSLRDTALRLTKEVPRIKIHQIITSEEACTHEVAVPENEEFSPLVPSQEDPAKTFPFTLDPFQRQAILCLENKQSVLVSAHTSAGKTVVAEYAIAMCLKNHQRVIYTTPIKALSNQKYRDFSEEFTDVGLITGDVTINPNASCLIMTTEILRSMLYRGDEVTSEVGWIIFDEIHYMRNEHRGYIWEESIILLNPSVHFIFLSATFPNANQFAQWIVSLHRQPCHVVYTDRRPTPLQHLVFPSGASDMIVVVDEHSNFLEENFDDAMQALSVASHTDSSTSDTHVAPISQNKKQVKKPGKQDSNSDCLRLLKLVMSRGLAPVVVFSFSKKDCEVLASQVSLLNFNSPAEKQLVAEVVSSALAPLTEDDKKIPQVMTLLPLLTNGIGVHHGGLLPILRETVEILFGEGLIKALFATETFAMGLNMPARTVVFTDLRKYDGRDYRWLTPGEYTQMSGRAGRRGKDAQGTVVMMADQRMDSAVSKKLVLGETDPMNSAFHLTYNMVLNLLRVAGLSPDYMIDRSFQHFQNTPDIPAICDRADKAEVVNEKLHVPRLAEVESYFKMQQRLDELQQERQQWITKPEHVLSFLQPGRIVKLSNGSSNLGWGALVKVNKNRNRSDPTAAAIFKLDVIVSVARATAGAKSIAALRPPVVSGGEGGEPVSVQVLAGLRHLEDVSTVRVKLPHDLAAPASKDIVSRLVRRAVAGVPAAQFVLDPVKNLGIKADAFQRLLAELGRLQQRLQQHTLHSDNRRDELLARYREKHQALAALQEAEVELRSAQSSKLSEDLQQRKRVLRRLGYLSNQDVLEDKGRVACELSTTDELLLTEMLFTGVFNDLTAAQTCALLSTFVCDEKSRSSQRLAAELAEPLELMHVTARRVARVLAECKFDVSEEEYLARFRPAMMDVVFDWCNGDSFLEISQKTTFFAGNIVRSMRRLEELLRQMALAAKIVGLDLEHKFAEGSRLLKRDVAFAASLYL